MGLVSVLGKKNVDSRQNFISVTALRQIDSGDGRLKKNQKQILKKYLDAPFESVHFYIIIRGYQDCAISKLNSVLSLAQQILHQLKNL